MKRTEISTDQAPGAVGPYAQAVRVGNFLFCSGQIPLTPGGNLVEGDITVQTRQVLTNLEQVLKAAGFSLDQVVKTTCFLKDFNDFAAFNTEYAGWFTKLKPARSTVEVARLPKDVLVEVEAIACLDG